uniref:Uncharacterized protein n=1 Tax=Kalanchoe fedtschenkoi TaxID=63787 RepID=A0A7N0SXX8_KALFE
MGWRKEYLDVILVPGGLLVLLCYHVFLVYRCVKFPEKTVIGYENHNKRAWVERMMQVDAKERGLAFSVMGSNISAATFLASTSLTLGSLIGTWVGSSTRNMFISHITYGSTSASIISVKYISLLACFLASFAAFVQSVRHYVHANLLLSMPNTDVPISFVEKDVIRGNLFWCIGLRGLYFATSLLLWIFGPIPMFLASVVTVAVLHILDTNSTPLHQFKASQQHNNLVRKMEEEITLVATRVGEHLRRKSPNGSSTIDVVTHQHPQSTNLSTL